jgi:methionyl-tRNA formyltransferase
METIRTVFAGTPKFAVPSLLALLAHPRVDIVAVYTQPDRAAGRGRRVTPGPVKQSAAAAGLMIEQPADLKSPAALTRYASYKPDLLVVAAYGLIIPSDYLSVPAAAINVHASLLPRWRGAAPIQRALMAGDDRTGISIMRVVERLDAGPVWLCKECPIKQTDTGGMLHDRLASLGSDALLESIDRFLDGSVVESPQNEALATYAEKITNRDRGIDWTDSSSKISRQVRALNPEPGATTRLGEIAIKVFECRIDETVEKGSPGSIVELSRGAITVATGDSAISILELQPNGKQPMSAESFINGYRGQL